MRVPLRKGDALFSNPALFHAGGGSVTADVQPVANLLRISSSLGRTMETIDRERMRKAWALKANDCHIYIYIYIYVYIYIYIYIYMAFSALSPAEHISTYILGVAKDAPTCTFLGLDPTDADWRHS